jgi:DNA-binding GntR family transcriptional regulator
MVHVATGLPAERPEGRPHGAPPGRRLIGTGVGRDRPGPMEMARARTMPSRLKKKSDPASPRPQTRRRSKPALTAVALPARSVPLKDGLADILTNEIMDGTLTPGDLLVERKLAERFGVSKTPVREALMQLQQQGLVGVVPRGGYFVTTLSVQDVHNIFQLRHILEGESAAAAAQHADSDELDRLEEHLKHMTAIQFVVDSDKRTRQTIASNYRRLNRIFHVGIARASKNNLLAQFIERLIVSMERVLSYDSLTEETLQDLAHQHRAIIDAIRGKDGGRARQLIAQHIGQTKERILGAL